MTVRLHVVAVLALFAASCGTMLSDEDFEAAGREVIEERVIGASGPGTPGGQAGTEGQAGTAGQTVTEGGTAGGGGGGGGTGGGGGEAGPNQASDVGVTESVIRVGNITAVQGYLGPEAFTPMRRGVSTYFQVLNEQGGVNGRKIEFTSCDDRESPDLNLDCARRLVENQQVFALVGNSTDTYRAARYVSESGVPDIGGQPIGNAYYRYPTLFSVLGAEGYPRDGSQVGQGGQLYIQTGQYRYFKQQAGVSRAAVFFYNIPISKTAGEFLADGLRREGVEVVYTPNNGAGTNPAAPSFDTDVIQMRSQRVDTVWNAIDVAGFQKLCQAMDRQGFTVKANVSTIQGWSQKVGQDFSDPCKDAIYAWGESAPYGDAANPVIAPVLDALERYDPGGTLHQWNIDGWAAGQMFTDAVASMGPAPTRAGVIDFLNQQRDYTAGGIMGAVDWRPQVDDFNSFRMCVSVAKWDDAAGQFVNVLGEPFRCETGLWYPYTPNDDGS